MERCDFSSIITTLRRYISDDYITNQTEFLEDVFQSCLENDSEPIVLDMGLVCRWFTGQARISPKISQYYAKVGNRAKLADAPELSDDEDIMPKSYWQSNIDWLTERFPEGKYRDVVGLCKIANIEDEDGIKDQDYSLNPGRYVGVVIEDDGLSQEDFQKRMMSYYTALSELNADAHNLEKSITQNLQELFEKK